MADSIDPAFQNHLMDDVGKGEQIYETGCLVTMEQWFNTNLYYIGGAALGVAVVQASVSILLLSIHKSRSHD